MTDGTLRVVIEFDSMDDYDEFMAQHHEHRCSDLGDWNTYRIVSDRPQCAFSADCEFGPHDPASHPCGKRVAE